MVKKKERNTKMDNNYRNSKRPYYNRGRRNRRGVNPTSRQYNTTTIWDSTPTPTTQFISQQIHAPIVIPDESQRTQTQRLVSDAITDRLRLKAEVETLNEKLQRRDNHIKTLKRELADCKNLKLSTTELEKSNEELKKNLELSRGKLNDAKLQVKTLQEQASGKQNQEEINKLKQKSEQQVTAFRKIEGEKKMQENQIKELQQLLNSEREKNTDFANKQAEKQNQDVERMKKDLEQLQVQNQTVKNLYEVAQSNFEKEREQRISEQDKSKKLVKQITELKASLEREHGQVNNFEKQLSLKTPQDKDEMEKLKTQNRKLTQTLNSLMEAAETLEKEGEKRETKLKEEVDFYKKKWEPTMADVEEMDCSFDLLENKRAQVQEAMISIQGNIRQLLHGKEKRAADAKESMEALQGESLKD
ncbi:unnamed protein product [Orchesella dallaii]|uniref:Uncharacterized protein n=1 Tax=Orchesella dallaii TaxID=48710 RepID=A0ABP1RHU6_9HEXA